MPVLSAPGQGKPAQRSLTSVQVEVLLQTRGKLSHRYAAILFGVTDSTVRMAREGLTYKDVYAQPRVRPGRKRRPS